MTKLIEEAIATYRNATTPAAIESELAARTMCGLPVNVSDAHESALESLIASLEGARS